MTGNQNGLVGRPLPFELRWDSRRPLPERWIHSTGHRHRVRLAGSTQRPFDFSAAMNRLCIDVVSRCDPLRHIQMSKVLVTFTPARNRSRYGLQARVTPLRFRDGALTRRHGPMDYQVQRFFVDGMEMLYLLTFCLPRYLEQTFDEKLITVFHELYHVSPGFDGDLRRHPGRYTVHSHSKAHYDSHMAELARSYVENHPEPGLFAFLLEGSRELSERHGGIVGTVVPRPKLLPLGWSTPRAAARRQESKSD